MSTEIGPMLLARIPVIVATLDDELEVADGIVAQGCIPADGQACPIPSFDAARNECGQRPGISGRILDVCVRISLGRSSCL